MRHRRHRVSPAGSWMYIALDVLALAPLTHRVTYLEEGDRVVVTSEELTIFDAAGHKVERSRDFGHVDWKRQFSALHAEGDLRATCGDWGRAARDDQPGERYGISPRSAVAAIESRQDYDRRLRHIMARRPRRQILAGTGRPNPSRGRYRFGVLLSRSVDGARRGRGLRLPVRRDRRYTLRRSAIAAAEARKSSPLSTSPKARSPAKPTLSCRLMQVRRLESLLRKRSRRRLQRWQPRP